MQYYIQVKTDRREDKMINLTMVTIAPTQIFGNRKIVLIKVAK